MLILLFLYWLTLAHLEWFPLVISRFLLLLWGYQKDRYPQRPDCWNDSTDLAGLCFTEGSDGFTGLRWVCARISVPWVNILNTHTCPLKRLQELELLTGAFSARAPKRQQTPCLLPWRVCNVFWALFHKGAVFPVTCFRLCPLALPLPVWGHRPHRFVSFNGQSPLHL